MCDSIGEPELVSVSGLQRLNARPTFAKYVKATWDRRFFILRDSRARAFSEQRDYFLGRFWLVAQPLLNAATYGFIFGFLLRTARGIDNFIGYLVLGITFVGFMTRGLTSGSGLLRNQRNLIRGFNFPRATIVVSRGLRATIDNLLPAFVAVLIALALQWPKFPGWSVVQVLPLYLLVSIFSAGLIFFSARLTALLPDTKVLLTFFARIWFYLSCVFYDLERFNHAPRIKAVIEQNPSYRFIDGVRAAVLRGEWISSADWLVLLGWSAGAFGIGLVYFWMAEERYNVKD